MSIEPGSRRVVCLLPQYRRRLQEILGAEAAEEAEQAGDNLAYLFENAPLDSQSAEEMAIPGSKQAEKARRQAKKALKDLEKLEDQIQGAAAFVLLKREVDEAKSALSKAESRLKVDRRGSPVPAHWINYLEGVFRAWTLTRGELPSLTRSEYVDVDSEEDRYPQMRELVEAARLAHPYPSDPFGTVPPGREPVPFDRLLRALKEYRSREPFRLSLLRDLQEG